MSRFRRRSWMDPYDRGSRISPSPITDHLTRPPARWWPYSPRAAVAAVVGVSLVLRLAWVALMPVNKDEGYHYLYSVHPAWSYFDHPPMMMMVVAFGVAFGVAACGGAVNFFSLRLGFVLLSAATSWMLGTWTARRYGGWAGVFAAVVWNLSPFYSLGAGGQAMPDGPFLFFALLTVIALVRAIKVVGTRIVPTTLPWVWVGLAWAAALLSKYHAVFLPAGAVLYVLLTPTARRVLLTPGPYLAVLIGLAGFSPVIYWNATHGWASFAFQGERAVGGEFHPEEIAIMLLRQMAYLTPGVWAALLVVLFGGVRRWRSLADDERLLLCMAVVPLAFFLGVSCVRQVHAHWTLVGFLPLLPMLGERCVGWFARWPRTLRTLTVGWAVVFVAAAFVFAFHARFGLLPVEPKHDPAREQAGWDTITAKLEERGLVGRPNTFVFTSVWHESGQIGFALAGRGPVTCLHVSDARGFAYWNDPQDFVGRDGVLVALDDRPWEPACFADYFDRIELVEEFWMTRNGRPLRHVRLFLCEHQRTRFTRVGK